MTNQNQTGNDPKVVTTPRADAAPKAAEPSDTTRELTDAETAAIAGGGGTASPKQTTHPIIATNPWHP
jgi:hypothetical protein